MRTAKLIFCILVILFGLLGLFELLPYSVSQPLMFLFLGLFFLLNAKELYDKGSKRDMVLMLLVAVFIFIILLLNLLS